MWLALPFVLATSLQPVSAWAEPTPVVASEPTPEAREANARAIELVRAGDFVGALEFFQRAYDLSPSYLILYNIGKMAASTRDPARALDAFDRYLSEGGPAIEPARRAEVEEKMRELADQVGTLRIEVDEAGAEIEVDGRSRGRSPLARPLWLNPGDHRVVVLGSSTDTRRIRIDAGASEALTVRLVPTSPPPAVVEESPIPSELRTAAWIATGVFALGATVTGTLALVTDADLADDTYVGPGRRAPEGSSVASKASRLQALATTTDVLVVLGAITGATAISLTLVDAFVGAPATTAPSARLSIGLGGAMLEGSF